MPNSLQRSVAAVAVDPVVFEPGAAVIFVLMRAYRWFPGVGDARDSTTDFYDVYVAESLADRGKAHDMMYEGGFAVAAGLYGEPA